VIEFKIEIFLHEGVLDTQGRAVANALHKLGFPEVNENVRVGKIIYLKMDESDINKASEKVKSMCEKLLANPTIENYEIKVV